jgi:predicted homoserine dehydrogenase-like protein
MDSENLITRKKFLYQAGMMGAAVAMASLTGEAKNLIQDGKKVRLGLIGCGSVSGVYLPHLTKCPYVEVVSVCDIIPERAKNRAAQFNVPNHYPSIEKMLAGAQFDLLVNTTDIL